MLISYKIFIHPIIIALIGHQYSGQYAHYTNVLFINQFTLFKHLIHLVSNFHSYLFANPCVNITLFQDSSRSIANILGENVSLQVLPEPDLEESDQSILDQHVLRIWKDKTPLRSPGDPAGRPLSPGGGYRRGKSQAMSSSLGPMQPHRLVFLFENEQIQPHRLVFIYQFSLIGCFIYQFNFKLDQFSLIGQLISFQLQNGPIQPYMLVFYHYNLKMGEYSQIET